MFEEHGLLLRQMVLRAEDVLAVLAADRWPARELQALLSYLHAEVLAQVADEERLLFPSHASSKAVEELRADHRILHLMTEFLANAAANGGRRAPAELAATTRDLLMQLERHLGAEEAALAAGLQAEAPGTTSLTGRRTSGSPSPRAGRSTWTHCPEFGSSTR
jgi:iron-sulfur cluster repair protein YtfE (RIC family)